MRCHKSRRRRLIRLSQRLNCSNRINQYTPIHCVNLDLYICVVQDFGRGRFVVECLFPILLFSICIDIVYLPKKALYDFLYELFWRRYCRAFIWDFYSSLYLPCEHWKIITKQIKRHFIIYTTAKLWRKHFTHAIIISSANVFRKKKKKNHTIISGTRCFSWCRVSVASELKYSNGNCMNTDT